MAGHVFVDRKNHERSMASLSNIETSLLKTPRSILLFPEGSRSNDGQIKPFKSGGLGLGISTGIPIVPVAIIGTFESLGKESTSFENNLLTVQIGSPIDTNEYIENDRKILSKLVYERVKELKRNHPV